MHPPAPPILVVCHPGHELRVYGWTCLARPLACVLTDGSGGTGTPRTASSLAVVRETGGTPGPLFGAIPDAALYQRLLDRDAGFFRRLADQLAGVILDGNADTVVGDAAEGYNPGHDVCRLLIDAAVAAAERVSGRRVANLAFPVVDRTLPGEPARRIALSPAALARKLAAARGYAGLKHEVDAAVARFGEAAFADERLFPVTPFALPDGPPRYEAFGRDRVAAGRYAAVIRRHRHLDPLADALRAYAREGPACGR